MRSTLTRVLAFVVAAAPWAPAMAQQKKPNILVIWEFLTTVPEYPFQQGSSLNAANINYDSLRALAAMKRLKQLKSLRPPSN